MPYPLRYAVDYPERLSRWLIFVKWFLAIPHYIILLGLGWVQSIIAFVAFIVILVTTRYPRELFDFGVFIQRWSVNVGAYVSLQRDQYPPFTGAAGMYPVTFEIDYPERLSRWLIFIKWLLIFPHSIILTFLSFAAFCGLIIAWFAILFTGRYPRGLFDFEVGVVRWSLRVLAYSNLFRDEYPPFNLA